MTFPQRRPFSAESHSGSFELDWTSGESSFASAQSFDRSEDILAAIAELRAEVAELKSGAGTATLDLSQDADGYFNDIEVRIEIARMVKTIAKAKTEIAAIKHPMVLDNDQMKMVSSQLDATVMATERATNSILEATENIEKLNKKVFSLVADDEDASQLTDQIGAQLVNIMEACNFQDITGQRISKVIKTLRFIEDRILALISLWGPQAFEDLPVSVQNEEQIGSAGEELHGPAMENEGISQDEIDALFD